MLRVTGLRAWHGETQALFGISLDVEAGEVLALIGTNGAGKSTTVNSIAGIVRSEGDITLDGVRISELSAWRRAQRGIALVPENRGLFWDMTVRENLEVGAGPMGRSNLEQPLDLFPRLKDRLQARAADLSGGEQQMLSIARALARKPALLMLDEPSLGLSPRLIEDVYERLRLLKQTGLTMLLVEQSIPRAMNFADSLCLLRTGSVALSIRSADVEDAESLAAEALGDIQRTRTARTESEEL